MLSSEQLNDIKYTGNISNILKNQATKYDGFMEFIINSYNLGKDSYLKDKIYCKNKTKEEYVIQDLVDGVYNCDESDTKKGKGTNCSEWNKDSLSVLVAYSINKCCELFGDDYLVIESKYLKTFKKINNLHNIRITEKDLKICKEFLGNIMTPTETEPKTKSKPLTKVKGF